MKNNYCVFDENKVCDNCGECDTCDLDPTKKCDNCGKCLEMEGYDMKAIKIDDIIDDENESRDYEEEDECSSNDSHQDDENLENKGDDKNDDKVEFIDDIDGLSEVLENKNSFKKFAREEYPGLIRINKKFKNK